jgi:CheY-like chemotaxis protein
MASLDHPRILIVEDEPVTAMRLEDVVRRLGAHVVGPAASVAEALALSDATEVDAALLDVNVAGVPVYAVADRLALREVPFVFLTGHAEAVPPAHADRPLVAKPAGAAEVTRALKILHVAVEAGPAPKPAGDCARAA